MLTKTELDPFLQEYWTPGRVESSAYEKRPLLAMMKKNYEIGGENWVVPIDLEDGADGGPTFSVAQTRAQATSSEKRQFVVSYVEDFQLAQIQNLALRLTRNNPKLALEKAAKETERARRILAQRIARNMYRSGYNNIGVVDATTVLASQNLVLTNKVDVRNFKLGQKITLAATMTAALRNAGATATVDGIDYGNKTIHLTANLSASIAAAAAGDVIFIEGGRGSGASPSLLTFQGLDAWIPYTAPTAGDSFNGRDRSEYVERMAGHRYDASGKPRGEGIIDALIHAANCEAYPDKLFLPPDVYGDFLKEMEGRYEKVQEKVGKIGFNGIEINIGYGSNGIRLFPDANCLTGYGWALDMSTWELGACDELIANDLQHGQGRDVENASAVEYRYVHTGAMVCNKPSANMVIKF